MKSLVTLSALITCLACSTKDDDPPATDGGSGGQSGSTSQSGSGGSPPTSGSGGGGGTSNNDGPLHGAIVVSLKAPTEENDGHTTVIARFFDAPTPNALPNRLGDEEGDCQLLIPDLPFCNDPCSPAVCTADDECTPYPMPLSVGTLTLSGLGEDVSVTPATTMFVYQAPSLPNPPCTEGADVVGKSDRFELTASCIPQLELTGADPIPVMTGEEVHVEWVPPADPSKSRIRIGLDISHHGGKKGEIVCDVADTGSYDIPATLVTQLIDLGLAGYPTINVNRVSVAETTDHGVSLVVSSDITRAVDTGVTSCMDPSQCPDEQTCSPAGICE